MRVNQLWHTFKNALELKMGIQNLGFPPLTRGVQKLPIFGWFYDDIAT